VRDGGGKDRVRRGNGPSGHPEQLIAWQEICTEDLKDQSAPPKPLRFPPCPPCDVSYPNPRSQSAHQVIKSIAPAESSQFLLTPAPCVGRS
jgi:hypothetical protein